MKFVSETTIDAVIENLEKLQDSAYEKKMDDFALAQPVIFSYIFSEQFDLLTEDEKGYLQYLALIIWASNDKTNPGGEAVSEDEIGEAEEENYNMLENTTGSGFRDRLNPFFEDYPQEDLLAFVEDALVEDEDPEAIVTKEGREPIFIALKTVIDVLAC